MIQYTAIRAGDILGQNQVKVLDQIQFISEVGKDIVQYVPGYWRSKLKFQVLIQYNTTQLFVIPRLLSGHFLIVDIHRKLGYVDI